MRNKMLGLVSFLFLGCTTSLPPIRVVNGIEVFAPDANSDFNPETIQFLDSLGPTLDSIKLFLVKRSFTLKEFDRKLGIVQTDYKVLEPGERYDFTPGQRTVLFGSSDISGYSQNGRLQVICKQIDTLKTTCDVTGYIKTNITQSNVYKDRNSEFESKMVRIHPLVQSFCCSIRKIDCGPVPGQKIYVNPSNSALDQNGQPIQNCADLRDRVKQYDCFRKARGK